MWAGMGQCGHVPLFMRELSVEAAIAIAIACDIRFQALQLFIENLAGSVTPESLQTLKIKAASLASCSDSLLSLTGALLLFKC